MQAFTQVDAFTSEPFAGNPAAVCVLKEERPDEWLAAVAREMNLSETAFLRRRDDGFSLRWFTPAVEVDLCGHATLASAHVLWEENHLRPEEPARFFTRSGWLTASRVGEGNFRGWIELDFPSTPPAPTPAPFAMLDALGLRSVPTRDIGRSSEGDWFVVVEDESIVRNLRPDFGRLREIDARGFIVTAPAGSEGYQFVSRWFGPRLGIDEDPVTGSAHVCLGPYWSARLGRDEVVGRQISARGGVVRVRPRGARCLIAGQAVTVLRGELLV